ncbi:hypothetical protein EI77_00166 [Prosthecobacter fusiformis]|uniref:AP2 domain-containing protein n=1 Tax=Prosthecobacter fusiformis TaxID=48464 RepID=A0A4R7SR20_9BACT|nr:hypothetical protein [Prosthecobacter fusiformis]TDU80866.1 hypothetical protein EI77_00166 [Prosthecobacter fusiformis]
MRRRSNPLSERNIKRIDTRTDASKQTHGFQVCISRNGALHTKHFSDSLYGGTKGALKVAREYRDQLLGEMPEIEASRIAHTTNAKNKSGHVGISYRKYKTAKGKVTRLIAVSVRAEKGKTVSRVYRYTKENHDEVLAEAISFREELLQQRLTREGGITGIVKAKAPKAKKTAPVKAAPAKKAAKKAAPAKKAPAKKAAPVKAAPAKKAPAKKVAPAKKAPAKKAPAPVAKKAVKKAVAPVAKKAVKVAKKAAKKAKR